MAAYLVGFMKKEAKEVKTRRFILLAKISVDTAENESSKVCLYTYIAPWLISSAALTEL